MSRSRGHGNVFALGARDTCRRYINSKAVAPMFIVNFLQRRMNTSYQKKLYRDLWTRRWVKVCEFWRCDIGQKYNTQSEIQLVRHDEEVIGKAHADGRVELKSDTLDGIRWEPQHRIKEYLTEHYNVHSRDGWSTYYPKAAVLPEAVAVPLPQTIRREDTFSAILEREWRV